MITETPSTTRPTLFVSFLIGHSHDDGDADAAGSVRSGPYEGAREADICRDVIASARAECSRLGVDAITLPDDVDEPGGPPLPYHAQMAKAEVDIARIAEENGVENWRHLCVHVHADHGAHRNRLLFYDHRSRLGKNASTLMATTDWRMYEPCVQSAVEFAARPEDWRKRAFNCICGSFALPHSFAVLVEIGNMSDPTHNPLWTPTGRVLTGQWLARAVKNVSLNLG